MININHLQTIETNVCEISDQILNSYFHKTTAQKKSDGSIVTEADFEMQRAMSAMLERLSPEIKMLGEEMDPQEQQLVLDQDKPYWCLDPVDGTNNFYHGVPLFSVSLALIYKQEIHLGIVYDPVRKEIFSAIKGSGLRINNEIKQPPKQPDQLGNCLASVDFKRLKNPLKQKLLENMPFKSQRNIGTCALEWAWLAAGRTQLLLHGGEKFWDYAAGCLLVDEAGGKSCTDTRESIFNSSLDARPVIAASNPALHRQWLEYLLD